MTSRSGKLSVLAGTLGVVACLAACGSADPMTGDTGPFVIGSMETVDSMPEGAIVVTPDQLASISYFTGINAADRLSLRRAMCEPSYSDEVIDAWVEFLRSDNVVGRLSGGRPASGDTHYPLVDGVEVAVTLTLDSLSDGQRCVSAVDVETNYRRMFVPPVS